MPDPAGGCICTACPVRRGCERWALEDLLAEPWPEAELAALSTWPEEPAPDCARCSRRGVAPGDTTRTRAKKAPARRGRRS